MIGKNKETRNCDERVATPRLLVGPTPLWCRRLFPYASESREEVQSASVKTTRYVWIADYRLVL